MHYDPSLQFERLNFHFYSYPVSCHWVWQALYFYVNFCSASLRVPNKAINGLKWPILFYLPKNIIKNNILLLPVTLYKAFH